MRASKRSEIIKTSSAKSVKHHKMVICCVPLCKSRSDRGRGVDKDGNRITFHEFPSSPKRRDLWVNFLLCQEPNPRRHRKQVIINGVRSAICSLHFHPRDYTPGLKVQRLRLDAVPSIFPDSAENESKKEDEPITEVACYKSTETGNNSTELQKLQVNANTSFNGNLPFQPSDFKSGLKLLCSGSCCFLPAEPNVSPKQSASVEQRVGSGKHDKPIAKVPCDKTSETGNTSRRKTSKQDSFSNKRVCRESMDVMHNDSVSSVEESFTFSKLLKNLLLVKKPNQFWGVTPTDKFIIFSRWNNKYKSVKRVVIENNLNIKVFFKELEINIMNLMELTCADDVSALLEKAESINFFEEQPVIN